MATDGKTISPSNNATRQVDSRAGEKDKALNLVLNQIERNFGKGSIMQTHSEGFY